MRKKHQEEPKWFPFLKVLRLLHVYMKTGVCLTMDMFGEETNEIYNLNTKFEGVDGNTLKEKVSLRLARVISHLTNSCAEDVLQKCEDSHFVRSLCEDNHHGTMARVLKHFSESGEISLEMLKFLNSRGHLLGNKQDLKEYKKRILSHFT